MMKKSILIAALGLFSLNTMAQDTPKEEGFVFTTVKENPITSIKNQNRAGTCWCYSGLAFIESELLRTRCAAFSTVPPSKYAVSCIP